MAILIPEVLETIRDFAEPLTVNRPATETVVDGYVTQNSGAVAGVSGHMQPMSDKELRNVPEGMNTMEWWNVWTLQAIQVNDKITDGQNAPLVKIEKLKWWKEGPFWHGQGVKVLDDTALPTP